MSASGQAGKLASHVGRSAGLMLGSCMVLGGRLLGGACHIYISGHVPLRGKQFHSTRCFGMSW